MAYCRHIKKQMEKQEWHADHLGLRRPLASEKKKKKKTLPSSQHESSAKIEDRTGEHTAVLSDALEERR